MGWRSQRWFGAPIRVITAVETDIGIGSLDRPRNEKQFMESCLIGLRPTGAVDPAKKLLK
jgi:hypothetical protein